MKKVIYSLVLAMLVLHQDFWFWDDRSLVFGFMPIGLAYHAGYSIAAACLAALAIKFAWPHDIESFVGETDTAPEAAASSSEPADN